MGRKLVDRHVSEENLKVTSLDGLTSHLVGTRHVNQGIDSVRVHDNASHGVEATPHLDRRHGIAASPTGTDGAGRLVPAACPIWQSSGVKDGNSRTSLAVL